MRRWAFIGAGMLAVLCCVRATGADRAIGASWLLDPWGSAPGSPAPVTADGASRTVGRDPGDRGDHAGESGGGAPGVAGVPGPPPEAVSAIVVRVIDGDTVVLRIGGRSRRVRLVGVDAPETWARHDCFGSEAARALRRLTPVGARVRAAGDRRPYDRFGRRLLHLWTASGRLVEMDLLRAGLGRLVVASGTRYAAALADAQARARRAGTGLWGACSPEG